MAKKNRMHETMLSTGQMFPKEKAIVAECTVLEQTSTHGNKTKPNALENTIILLQTLHLRQNKLHIKPNELF